MPRPAQLRPVLLAAALLAGCDLTLPWYRTPPVDAKLEASPASLGFAAALGGGPPPLQTIDLRVTPGWLEWFAFGEFGSGVVSVGGFTELGDGWRRYEVAVADPNALGAGTHTGRIEVDAYQPCDGYPCPAAPGSPWYVPVTYVVGPRLIEASPASVAFEQELGGAVAPPQVVALAGPADGGAWTSTVEFYGQPPWLGVTPASGATLPAEVQLQVSAPATQGPRLVSATLRFTRGGATAEVSVALTERPPAITTTTPELFFTGVEGEPSPPPPQDVVLRTTTGAESPFYVSTGAAWWMGYVSPSTAPTTVPVGPNTTQLAPGRHEGVLGFWPTWSADQSLGTTVQVHYDVLPRRLGFGEAAVHFELGPATVPADVARTVAVTSTDPALAWTAEPLVPWLEVSPGSGTGAGSVDVAVSLAAVPTLPLGWSEGRVALRYVDPVGGPVAVELRVTVANLLSSIRWLSPRIGVAGSGATLAGRFDPWPGADPVVLFDGVPSAATSALPDGTWRVTPPALAAGRHAAWVRNGLGVALNPVDVDVVDAVTRPGASVPSPGRKGSVVFDDAAAALWVANPGAGRVERYAEADGWARAERAFAGLQDAAPSPDGRLVLVVTLDGALTVDAAALGGAVRDLAGGFDPGERALPWRMAFAADGVAAVATPALGGCAGLPSCGIHFASPAQGTFWLGYVGSTADGWRAAAPDDGARAWFLRGGVSPPAPLGTYLATANMLDFASPVAFDGTALDLDRHGARVLLLDVDPAFAVTDGRVAETATGSFLPGRLPGTTAAALLSQDGARAVAFDGLARTVRVFDLAAPPDPGSGRFAELGTPGGFAPPGDPGAEPVLALSADERTLFLAGDDAVVVCPLP